MAKVLIVDDDVGMRITLTRVLIASGHDVAVEADGVKGLAAYRSSPADVLLIDLCMPNKSGLETMVEVRQEFPQAVIIAMSGSRRMDQAMRSAQSLTGVLTLEKPFEAEELVAAIEQALLARACERRSA